LKQEIAKFCFFILVAAIVAHHIPSEFREICCNLEAHIRKWAVPNGGRMRA